MITEGREADVLTMISDVTAALKRDFGRVFDFSQVENPETVLTHLKDRITTGR